MELWIRSQDKNVLENVKGFCITHSSENCWNILNVDTTTRYGTYKTKERALEILDEIQKLIQPSTNFIISQHIDFDNNDEGLIGCNILKQEPKIEKISDCIVYEMPKD